MENQKLLYRITYNPDIFGGKPIIRGRRLAVEHVLGMLAAGDTIETLLQELFVSLKSVPRNKERSQRKYWRSTLKSFARLQ